MGDRGTLQIVEEGKGVELYTHWGGVEELAIALAYALEHDEGRRSDAPYFVRIVVDALTKDATDPTTGYGVWVPGSLENEHSVFVFDVGKQKITYEDHTYSVKEFLAHIKTLTLG
jgi:hypothetical protein